MTFTYSTYEAKARFSELLQKVRDGHRVLISYRGQVVAELRATEKSLEPAETLKELEVAGVLAPGTSAGSRLAPLRRRRGALARFLASRE
jgi:prevent-host-death family protein